MEFLVLVVNVHQLLVLRVDREQQEGDSGVAFVISIWILPLPFVAGELPVDFSYSNMITFWLIRLLPAGRVTINIAL
jgi:hypothetical protein